MWVFFLALCMFLFPFFDFYIFMFIFSVTASLRCWATSVASSSSTRWSSVCGCWPSVLSSVSSWGATTSFQPCLTSSRSLSRRRSLESFWLPSGYVEILSLVQHFSKIPLFTKNVLTDRWTAVPSCLMDMLRGLQDLFSFWSFTCICYRHFTFTLELTFTSGKFYIVFSNA